MSSGTEGSGRDCAAVNYYRGLQCMAVVVLDNTARQISIRSKRITVRLMGRIGLTVQNSIIDI